MKQRKAAKEIFWQRRRDTEGQSHQRCWSTSYSRCRKLKAATHKKSPNQPAVLRYWGEIYAFVHVCVYPFGFFESAPTSFRPFGNLLTRQLHVWFTILIFVTRRFDAVPACSGAAFICRLAATPHRLCLVAVSAHHPKNNSHRSLCRCPSKRSSALHELFVNSMAGGLDVNEAGEAGNPLRMIGQSAWVTHSRMAFHYIYTYILVAGFVHKILRFVIVSVSIADLARTRNCFIIYVIKFSKSESASNCFFRNKYL